MRWQSPADQRFLCRAPVEVDAIREGELAMWTNAALDRHWSLCLYLAREQVLRWDFTNEPGGHNNPPAGVCPPDFPRKVPEREHEHVWVEGWDTKCARPLEGLAAAAFGDTLRAFCDHTRIDFQAAYVAPPIAQLRFPEDV